MSCTARHVQHVPTIALGSRISVRRGSSAAAVTHSRVQHRGDVLPASAHAACLPGPVPGKATGGRRRKQGCGTFISSLLKPSWTSGAARYTLALAGGGASAYRIFQSKRRAASPPADGLRAVSPKSYLVFGGQELPFPSPALLVLTSFAARTSSFFLLPISDAGRALLDWVAPIGWHAAEHALRRRGAHSLATVAAAARLQTLATRSQVVRNSHSAVSPADHAVAGPSPWQRGAHVVGFDGACRERK